MALGLGWARRRRHLRRPGEVRGEGAQLQRRRGAHLQREGLGFGFGFGFGFGLGLGLGLGLVVELTSSVKPPSPPGAQVLGTW